MLVGPDDRVLAPARARDEAHYLTRLAHRQRFGVCCTGFAARLGSDGQQRRSRRNRFAGHELARLRNPRLDYLRLTGPVAGEARIDAVGDDAALR